MLRAEVETEATEGTETETTETKVERGRIIGTTTKEVVAMVRKIGTSRNSIRKKKRRKNSKMKCSKMLMRDLGFTGQDSQYRELTTGQ